MFNRAYIKFKCSVRSMSCRFFIYSKSEQVWDEKVAVCVNFIPVCACNLSRACSLRTRNLLVLRMNFLGSLLLCFLGVALLKIVYKKAKQQADFYFYKYVFQISVQSNDIILHKSRAIAGQRGLPLLYQQ